MVGGTSAEYALKTAKYASARYLDSLPTTGSAGGHAFRDLELEAEVLAMTQQFGIGAQFGGKYFCHDVRVVRLPRHGASCPIAIAVSCSADRQALAKITPEGVFLEQLETEPAHYLPEVTDEHLDDDVVRIDLSRPMDEIRAELSRYPVKTRLSLSGPLVVARDIAHARIKDMLDHGEPMPSLPARPCRLLRRTGEDSRGHGLGLLRPDHRRSHGRLRRPVPEGRRLAGDAGQGQPQQGRHAGLQDNGGFYLGSIGGPAARLAQDCIKHVEVIDFPENGMEAVWRIEVEDFPAFIVVDDKGEDFFAETLVPLIARIPVGPPS